MVKKERKKRGWREGRKNNYNEKKKRKRKVKIVNTCIDLKYHEMENNHSWNPSIAFNISTPNTFKFLK